jgi:hypothetical protein
MSEEVTSWVVRCVVVALVLLIFWLGRTSAQRDSTRKESERQSIENTAATQPPLRVVPLSGEEEAVQRSLNCVVFPIRSYDNLLLHCTACREETPSMAEKPLAVTCVR